MTRLATRKARLGLPIAAVIAVSAALSAAIVAATPGPSDASPLTITAKPRLIDETALAALSGLPTLSAAPGLTIARAHGEHDEDCAVVGPAQEMVCKR